MFSGFKLLKAETALLFIWPGLEKGRETQKYDQKTAHEKFHFKKNATHTLVPNLLPLMTETPPLLPAMKGSDHHQTTHLHHCLPIHHHF